MHRAKLTTTNRGCIQVILKDKNVPAPLVCPVVLFLIKFWSGIPYYNLTKPHQDGSLLFYTRRRAE